MDKEAEVTEESVGIVIAVNRYALVTDEKAWRETLKAYAEIPCETVEDEDMWSGALAHAQTEFKRIDGDRSEIALPMDRDLKKVNKWFRAPLNALDDFKKLASSKLSACRQLRDERAAELRLAAEAAAEDGDSEAVYGLLATVPEPVKLDGTSVRYAYEIELIHEPIIDRRFMSFDEKKVREALAALPKGTIPEWAGLKIKYVPKVQATGRK